MKPWILTRDGVLNTLSSFEKLGTFFSNFVEKEKKKIKKKPNQTKKKTPNVHDSF